MSYHVGRNNTPLGQFTEAEIREGFERGTFFATDLTWREGMAEWRPLDQVFGFVAAQSLTAPLSVFGPAASGSAPPAMQPGHVGVGVMPTPGTAVASLVLGVLSLFLLFLCFIGGGLAIPGVICGHMALGRIKRSGGQLQGRGMALAGLAVSYATIAIALVFVLFFGLVFGLASAGAK